MATLRVKVVARRVEATDILARTKTPLLIGMGRFLGADRVGDLDPRALPALRHIVVVGDSGDGRRHSNPAGAHAERDDRAATTAGHADVHAAPADAGPPLYCGIFMGPVTALPASGPASHSLFTGGGIPLQEEADPVKVGEQCPSVRSSSA